jgi:hypothetical protein
MGVERALNTIKELLGRKCRDSGLEHREYDRGDPLALTSRKSGCLSVGIVRLRPQATGLVLSLV